MTDTVIRVENLSKKYVLSHQQEGQSYKSLRDAISTSASALMKPFQGAKAKHHNPGREEFWALKDVNFEIKQGDRVGIIGRNGAGKSTLLKILSRIVEPTSGSIRIKGRVASLLEVGTGFHPELTGRENVFLNGAILGMSKTEIKHKFDEIVAFAEIEKFLDTPVKRYSSGMYVRLAFAVAAHLEPEILIVDEVLAVGDAQFQKKCLGKMGEVAHEGRTILFVSHSMGAVSSLCDKAIYLDRGCIREMGAVDEVSTIYLSELFDNKITDLSELRLPGMGKEIYLSDIKLIADENKSIYFGEAINYELTISSKIDANNLNIGTSIFSSSGTCVGSLVTQQTFSVSAYEKVKIHLSIPETNIVPGSYYASFGIGKEDTHIYFDAVVGKPTFQVLAGGKGGQIINSWNNGWGNICFRKCEIMFDYNSNQITSV